MDQYQFDIQEELKKLPGKPGVYIMHDEKDEIIYVGKAISLKNRVRQYFQSSRNKGVKIEQMVTHIRRFEYIVTDSELEALVLECNLIKEHHPKYNTMLMDDKTYPFIKVTVGEDYPRIMLARRIQKDKAKYFGPYTSSGAVREVQGVEEPEEQDGKTVKKEMRIAMKPVEGQEVPDTVNEEKEAVSDMEITPSETDADMNLSAPAAEEDTKVPTSEEKIEEVKEEEAQDAAEDK